jgi:hypothetical protein
LKSRWAASCGVTCSFAVLALFVCAACNALPVATPAAESLAVAETGVATEVPPAATSAAPLPLAPSTVPAPSVAPSASASASALPVAETLPAVRYPFHEALPSRFLPKSAPAERIADMSPAQCRRELLRRKLPVTRERRATRGVADALRITGPFNGVRFVTPGAKSPYGLLDCRLALILDELSQLLAEHNVAAVRVDNLYRPGARLPGRRSKKSQHSYGLAIDTTGFTLSDGTSLSVEEDWGSPIGSVACGSEAHIDTPTERSVPLRNLFCAIARAGLFHHLLTPGHDEAHGNHLHLDIKRGERTSLVD